MNKKNQSEKELPPYKCKVCGMYEIEFTNEICPICGWEDDGVQNSEPDYMGGANSMSLNQYKEFWKETKDDILKKIDVDPFCAIEEAQKYYESKKGEFKDE